MHGKHLAGEISEEPRPVRHALSVQLRIDVSYRLLHPQKTESKSFSVLAPGLDPQIAVHYLAIDPKHKPVKQPPRRFRPELEGQIIGEVDKQRKLKHSLLSFLSTMMKTRSNSKVKPFTSLFKLLNMGWVHTFWMLSYSRHTTHSFEATTTTEAGLLVLVTGWGFETRERRSGWTCWLAPSNKVAKTGGLFQ